MYMLCRHIKPDGVRCQAPALREKPYCFFHDHFHREVGKSLKKTKSKKRPIALPRLEDRESVLAALSDVIGALGAGHIDSSTAGRLIYGLQVAGQFAQTYAPSDAPKVVQSFTVAEDGAEMAGEFYICEHDDECDGCFRIERCALKDAVKFRADHPDEFPADDEDETEPDKKDSGDDDDDKDDNDDNEDDDNEEDGDDKTDNDDRSQVAT